MKIFLSNDIPNHAIVQHTLQLIALNKKEKFIQVQNIEHADLSIGIESKNTIQLSSKFFELLQQKTTQHQLHLNTHGRITTPDTQKTDYLSTIFYYVNCVQEYHTSSSDHYGRFNYADSIQKHLGITHTNFVQQLIDEFCNTTPQLNILAQRTRPSKLFLTHDIDYIYKAKNEDGMFALKNKRWLTIFKLLFNHYIGTPDWLNIDRIIAIEKKHGFNSTFFWLTIRDELNSDYNIQSDIIQKQLKLIQASANSIGLHKAIGNTTFESEIKQLPQPIVANRYHFLKFTVNDFQQMQSAGIQLDTSLGFAEEIGFRNSYGLPFMPFDLNQNKTSDLIEVPLNLMDRTLFNSGKSLSEQKETVFNWLNANRFNSIITIDWHNNFFSSLSYNGYQNLYEEILQHAKENNIDCCSPNELIEEFGK